MLSAAKEEMLSSFVPWSADECIRAFESEGKKPHQGVAPQNPALHQGIAWSNSTSALGLRSLAVENRVGSRCTGKERDTESGLDMFGARYYGSSLGRFMTPDWAAKPTAVPYASFGNPQSLNLYSYVENNPLSRTDPDGHCDVDGEHHGGLWCAAHALGFTETKKEYSARIDYAQKHPITPTQSAALQGENAAVSIIMIGMAARGSQASVDELVSAEATSTAASTAEVSNPNKALASDLQVEEITSGSGTPMAGAGTGKTLRDAPRLAAEYGGAPEDWVKIVSSTSVPPGGSGGFDKAGYNGSFEVHAYQNVKTGQIVELKTKFQ